MADTLAIEIVSPASPSLELHAQEVRLPGAAGVITIMPGHTEVLTLLNSGVVTIHHKDDVTFFAVHGGFVEVLKKHVLILADGVESGKDIDVARAKAARERAESRLEKSGPDGEDTDVARAEAALGRALARLQAHAREHY